MTEPVRDGAWPCGGRCSATRTSTGPRRGDRVHRRPGRTTSPGRVGRGVGAARPGPAHPQHAHLALLAALRCEDELAMHVRAALGNGVTPAEIPRCCCTRRSTPACRRPTRPSAWPSGCLLSWGFPRPSGWERLAVTEVRAERDSDFVQSLERGLAVICAFDRDNTELTLSEVAAATGVTRATARRFLLTLVRAGLRAHRRAVLLADPAGAGAGLRVPVQPVPCPRWPSRTSRRWSPR